jgi:hypothetical protein
VPVILPYHAGLIYGETLLTVAIINMEQHIVALWNTEIRSA